jgi:hypothetical protein
MVSMLTLRNENNIYNYLKGKTLINVEVFQYIIKLHVHILYNMHVSESIYFHLRCVKNTMTLKSE